MSPHTPCPPNSLDLNPLDYFVLGEVEGVSNATPHPIKESLKAAIASSFKKLNKTLVENACNPCRGPIIDVINAGDHYIA